MLVESQALNLGHWTRPFTSAFQNAAGEAEYCCFLADLGFSDIAHVPGVNRDRSAACSLSSRRHFLLRRLLLSFYDEFPRAAATGCGEHGPHWVANKRTAVDVISVLIVHQNHLIYGINASRICYRKTAMSYWFPIASPIACQPSYISGELPPLGNWHFAQFSAGDVNFRQIGREVPKYANLAISTGP